MAEGSVHCVWFLCSTALSSWLIFRNQKAKPHNCNRIIFFFLFRTLTIGLALPGVLSLGLFFFVWVFLTLQNALSKKLPACVPEFKRKAYRGDHSAYCSLLLCKLVRL